MKNDLYLIENYLIVSKIKNMRKLREGNKLTFGKVTIEIKSFEAIMYMTKEVEVNYKYIKI